MSNTEPLDPLEDRDDKTVAAEFSLGLLEGEELLAVRGRMARDADFAARREWWDNWFVPLSDDVAGAEPSTQVWSTIDARVGALQRAREADAVGDAASDGVAIADDTMVLLDMERRMRRWKWTAGITSAAAAFAVAMLVVGPSANPDSAPIAAPNPDPTTATPLMASIPIGDTPLRLAVTVLPESDEMLVSAAGLSADGVHDHELWLVPSDGSALQSLGVVVPGEERRMELPAGIARNMGDGVKLVLTREPIGGKPEGQDAGPVVAQGALGAV